MAVVSNILEPNPIKDNRPNANDPSWFVQVRLFSVIKYESLIHEFDPWFNYRVTQYLTEEGFYKTWDFFDSFTWYPLGRVVGGTMYPVSLASLPNKTQIAASL